MSGDYKFDDYRIEFDPDSTIDSWWIELRLGNEVEEDLILSLTDAEALMLAEQLVAKVEEGRKRDLFQWSPARLPEHDGTEMLKRLLKGIGDTWSHPMDMPDWRENEYARGQIELIVESIRITEDDEVLDQDDLKDRVWRWVESEVWR